MSSNSYTIDELLGFRVQDNHLTPPSLSGPGPEPTTVVRVRRGENSTAKRETREDPPVKKNQDDSPDDYEEIIFKGNASRRSATARRIISAAASATSSIATKATASATTPAAILATISAAVPVDVTADVPADVPTCASAPIPVPAQVADYEVEWKYRGRSNSEVPTNEPVSAPTGLPAQKNEGFQRFYKAVVSPTHVRVTAGGRIVPNNRGLLSPAPKRPVKDAAIESHATQEKSSITNPIPGFPGAGQQLPAGVPQYFPAFPHGYPPIPPFMPMAFGPPMPGGFHMPTAVAGAMVSQSLVEGAMKNMHDLKTGDGQADKATEPMKDADQVKLSQPEQFDNSKPFVYNGQWMVPVPSHFPPPMGNPFMPGPMIGPPHMMGPPIHMPQQMAPPPNLGPPMIAPGAFQMPFPGHPGFVGGMTAPGPNNKSDPPTAPPISSIKPSDITTKQIASFRTSLKYHEDQLQYNRHQIDEKFMENKVKAIREHIQNFELLLRTQLEHEKIYYPKSEKDNVGESKPQPAPAPVLKDPSQASRGSAPTANYGRNKTQPQHPAINNASGKEEAIAFNFDPSGSVAPAADPAKKPSFPSDAARAPAFQPRGKLAPHTDNTDSDISWGMTGCPSKASEKTSGRRRLPASDGQWRVFTESSESAGSASRPYDNSAVNALPAAMAKVKAKVKAKAKAKAWLDVPYLVGTLPKGVDPRNAQDTDYQYTRKLTEDEIRSRHLYWGKAPQFVLQGLPKYDGKHFYPPSPVEEGLLKGLSELGLHFPNPERDPFHSSAPTPAVNNKVKAASNDDTYASAKHTSSSRSQIYDGSNELQKALDEDDLPRDLYPNKLAPVDTGVNAGLDTGSVSLCESRPDKSVGVKFWQTMGRKGDTSSAVSSTTAQGCLPHYAGYAAKSLSPPMGKTPPSSKRGAPLSKTSDSPDLSDGGAMLTPVPAKRAENRLQNGEGSLEEQFRNVVSVDVTNRGNLSSTLTTL